MARTPPTPRIELLVEAHLPSPDVELVRDRAVALVVLGRVRVQEQDRHAADLGGPDVGLHLAAGQLHGDRQRVRPRERAPARAAGASRSKFG